jgi:hypothetical protein
MSPPKAPPPLPDVGIGRAGRSEAGNEAGKAFGDEKPGQRQFVVAETHHLRRWMEELVAAQLRMASKRPIMFDLHGDDGVEIFEVSLSQVDEAWRIARVQIRPNVFRPTAAMAEAHAADCSGRTRARRSPLGLPSAHGTRLARKP